MLVIIIWFEVLCKQWKYGEKNMTEKLFTVLFLMSIPLEWAPLSNEHPFQWTPLSNEHPQIL